MARLTLRTVEPAKLLACQSEEKDCTRTKASLTISSMLRAARGFQKRNEPLRQAAKPILTATKNPQAPQGG